VFDFVWFEIHKSIGLILLMQLTRKMLVQLTKSCYFTIVWARLLTLGLAPHSVC